MAGFTYGNGVARTMTQNKRGLPDEVRDVGVLWDDYAYDANGNVTGITDKQESVSTRSMTYDYLDRLATVNAPAMWGNAVIGTDLLDNVNLVTIPSGPTARTSVINYDAATHRISSITGSAPAVSFAYDSQGNISTRGTAGYVFDQGNRLASATGKASYVYDGLGRRVKTAKTDGSNLIHVYSQEGELLYSSTAVGAATPVETLYVNLNGHLLAEVGGAYVHTDGLGSPIARTNAARSVLSRTRYEPYGLTASGTTPTVGYTGHVNDADTGLVYMQQRYYDPVAARFLSTDSVLTDANTGGSFNRYSYANSNPYKYTDPNGRTAYEKFKALGLLVRNGQLTVHPKTGIPFKGGFPDFSKVATHTVEIKQTGNHKSDYAAANAAAGLKSTPLDFTWHHVEDGKTMQLVPPDIHAQTGHSGGAALAKALGAIALGTVVGDTGAEVIVGDKPATSGNVGLSVQDFVLNLLPFSAGVNSAGEGSDKFPLPEKKDGEKK